MASNMAQAASSKGKSPAQDRADMSGLAQARCEGASDFAGVHLFCFGGFVRTCRWLQAVADGRFTLDDTGGFRV
jgi:hypothetical protein